jgi:5'-nucleotidase
LCHTFRFSGHKNGHEIHRRDWQRWLNVNVPHLPEGKIRGYRVTRQGLRVYRDRLDQRTDPRGRPYYWIGGDAPTGIPERGTDFGALADGYVSICPLQLDLTAYPAMPVINHWSICQRNGNPPFPHETASEIRLADHGLLPD